LDVDKVEVDVHNGRGRGFTVDENGFELAEHHYEHVDYYDSEQVVTRYYPAIAAWLRERLNAHRVYVFDHNVRSAAVEAWMNKQESSTGASEAASTEVAKKQLAQSQQTVQSAARVVHNDYTLTSAPLRVRQLSERPRVNDAWNLSGGSDPLIPADEYEELLGRRWALVNVWRNIADTPVEDVPLALCNASTIDLDQLVTFEIRYKDRVGENYFAQHRPHNEWVYFPRMVKEEALVLKVWDTHGEQVRALDPVSGERLAAEQVDNGVKTVPASFSFHSAFVDPSATEGCAPRQSIEVRTVVVY